MGPASTGTAPPRALPIRAIILVTACFLAPGRTAAEARGPFTGPSPASAQRLAGSRSIEQLIHDTWRAEAPAALAVARCESRIRNVASAPNADGTRDWGVFQLNDGGTLQSLGGTHELALVPEWNIGAAHRLWLAHGWTRWRCRPR